MRIDGAALDKFVEQAALGWLAGPGLVRARQQLAQREADHKAIQAQLAADQTSLAELADAYADPANAFGIDEYLRAREPIQRRIAAAQEKLSQVPRLAAVADLPATEKALARAWKKLPVASRRAILRAVIDTLAVGPGTPGRQAFDESRVLLTFIDRQATGGTRTAIVPVELPDDPELAGIKQKIEREGPPQHETDEGVLGQVARSLEEPTP
jgi:hypothetical protein